MSDEIEPDRPRKKRPRDEIQQEPEQRRRKHRDEEEEPEEVDEEPVRRRKKRRYEDDEDDPDRFRQEEGDATGGIIPYKNPKALIAYYCGVFSLIPCLGGVLGPIALILGFMGLGYHKQHPTAGGVAHAIVGIVLGILTTLFNVGIVVFVGGLAFFVK
jgi:hypothetical protein